MDKVRQALDRAKLERDRKAPDITRPAPGFVGSSAVVPAERSNVVTVLPATLERNRVVFPGVAAAPSASFRQLRAQVLQRLAERQWCTVGVVSPRASEGKTTVAVNLSLAISADPRQNAVLVDLDLHKPMVATRFGLSPLRGVEHVLRGEDSLDDCEMHPDLFNGLTIVPASSAVPDASVLIAGSSCTTMIANLRARHPGSIVLIDLPPILDADEAVTIAPQLDCMLMVVAEGETLRPDLTRALELLRSTAIVGTVLNRSIEAVRSEAYGRSKYYL